MSVLSSEFLGRILRMGNIAKALDRARAGVVQPHTAMSAFEWSTWALVCEEVIDTELSPESYDTIAFELHRRGFSDDRIDAMRIFAWQTAGWLNFDKMLWNWCYLDERDMQSALDWQLSDGVISPQDYDDRCCWISNPMAIPSVAELLSQLPS